MDNETETIIEIENNECPICYNNIEENTLCITNCDHYFCLAQATHNSPAGNCCSAEEVWLEDSGHFVHWRRVWPGYA